MEAHAGKFRPLLLDSAPSLDDSSVKSSSQKALHWLSVISKAVSELTVLIGVGPATGLCSRCLRCCDGAVYVQRESFFSRNDATLSGVDVRVELPLKGYKVTASCHLRSNKRKRKH